MSDLARRQKPITPASELVTWSGASDPDENVKATVDAMVQGWNARIEQELNTAISFVLKRDDWTYEEIKSRCVAEINQETRSYFLDDQLILRVEWFNRWTFDPRQWQAIQMRAKIHNIATFMLEYQDGRAYPFTERQSAAFLASTGIDVQPLVAVPQLDTETSDAERPDGAASHSSGVGLTDYLDVSCDEDLTQK